MQDGSLPPYRLSVRNLRSDLVVVSPAQPSLSRGRLGPLQPASHRLRLNSHLASALPWTWSWTGRASEKTDPVAEEAGSRAGSGKHAFSSWWQVPTESAPIQLRRNRRVYMHPSATSPNPTSRLRRKRRNELPPTPRRGPSPPASSLWNGPVVRLLREDQSFEGTFQLAQLISQFLPMCHGVTVCVFMCALSKAGFQRIS
ncbi:unnamed protein product [Protopolystoma xenopodis]|uniref:Uncharacterized protein n=1 Tax=Protopolystoma xenopodis TaxID=117903 RepID=A0A3S5AQX3_9PLAT|nr:unnamed protein product [Protopolystoma xenopodis]